MNTPTHTDTAPISPTPRARRNRRNEGPDGLPGLEDAVRAAGWSSLSAYCVARGEFPGALYGLARGRTSPTGKTIVRLARDLNTSADALLGLVPVPAPMPAPALAEALSAGSALLAEEAQRVERARERREADAARERNAMEADRQFVELMRKREGK